MIMIRKAAGSVKAMIKPVFDYSLVGVNPDAV